MEDIAPKGKENTRKEGGVWGARAINIVFCQTGNSSDQSAVSTFSVTQPSLETDEGAGIIGEEVLSI